MPNQPSRLPPRLTVLRELYLLSGNVCAFPNCSQTLVDQQGDFVGEVCHIEAAEPGGPRFNSALTPEARRRAENLILLCRNHHKKTDNVKLFPVANLRSMKAAHEKRFLNVTEKILESLKDHTEGSESTQASNLKRLDAVLNWKLSREELEDNSIELSKHIDLLLTVPVETREFLAKIAARIYKMRKTSSVHESSIGTHDIENAFKLSQGALSRKGEELQQYGLGSIEEYESHGPLKYVVSIYSLDQWPLWIDLAEFCCKTGTDMEVFWRDLNFKVLDG